MSLDVEPRSARTPRYLAWLSASPGSPWWWCAAVFGYVLAALAFVFSRSGTDPDLWGHLRFGRDFWLTWSVNRPDPYSFVTGGQQWINHEWLAEAVSWAAWSAGGTAGVVALKCAIGLVIAGLLLWHLRRRGVVAPLAGLLIVLAGVILGLGLYSLRPQAFTYLCFTILLLVLERADRGHLRGVWWLVPLFALWANLHGGFLAGLGILGLFALGSLAEGVVRYLRDGSLRQVFARPLVLVAALCALATWINPYGVGLWAFLRTAFAARGEIAEWNPILVGSVPGMTYLVLAIATWIGVAASPRRVSPVRMVTLFVTTVAPLLAIRHAPLFAVAFVVFGAEHTAAAAGATEPTEDDEGAVAQATDASGWGRRLLAGLLVAQSLGIVALLPRNFSCISMDEEMPVAAVAVLRASGVRGNLALVFDWGEYAIWHLAPALKVSIDGRRETVYPDAAYWRDYRFTFALGDDWDRLLREAPVDFVLTSRVFPAFSAMKLRPGWDLVYEDSQAGIFAPHGSAGAGRVRAVRPPSAGAPCFP